MKINPPAFILIPYQLLADERIKPVEEKLYGFIYWFTRLKNERCTAGNDALAQLVQTTPGVIQNSLTNLEKRGYIRRVFKDRNKRVREEIIPLIDFANVETRSNEVETPKTPKAARSRKAAKTKEVVPVDEQGATINKLLELFKEMNPSYERLYAIRPQRAALERLIKKHGLEKTERMIQAAASAYGKDYAPTITTPVQLETKLGALASYWQRENTKSNKAGAGQTV